LSNQLKQRFLSLDVDEISVVDTPAVEVEFLVAKRLEEEPMETAEETVTETNNESQPEVVSVESESTHDDAEVTKALAHVASMVENVAKAAGVKLAPETQAATEEASEDEETEEQATEKAAKGMGGMRDMYMKQLKGAGIKGDALKTAMEKFDKQFKPFQPGASTQPPVKKNAEPETPQPTAEELAEQQTLKALEGLEAAIQKAKRFTPAREAALKQALETLKALYEDMKAVPQGASPATTVPGNTSFGSSGVQALTKSIEQLTQTVSKSVEGQAELAQRVEAIEKSRTPSQSIEDEGGTETQETKKSFWSGVL